MLSIQSSRSTAYMSCRHEEAGTRILEHIGSACAQILLQNIVIRCVGTGSLIILHTANSEVLSGWMSSMIKAKCTRLLISKSCAEN